MIQSSSAVFSSDQFFGAVCGPGVSVTSVDTAELCQLRLPSIMCWYNVRTGPSQMSDMCSNATSSESLTNSALDTPVDIPALTRKLQTRRYCYITEMASTSVEPVRRGTCLTSYDVMTTRLDLGDKTSANVCASGGTEVSCWCTEAVGDDDLDSELAKLTRRLISSIVCGDSSAISQESS